MYVRRSSIHKSIFHLFLMKCKIVLEGCCKNRGGRTCQKKRKHNCSEAFYAQDDTVVLEKMNTTTDGLSAQEAQKRLETYGENVLDEGKKNHLP